MGTLLSPAQQVVLNRALARLPARERAIVLRIDIGDGDVKAIADSWKLTEERARQIRRRALLSVREQMGGQLRELVDGLLGEGRPNHDWNGPLPTPGLDDGLRDEPSSAILGVPQPSPPVIASQADAKRVLGHELPEGTFDTRPPPLVVRVGGPLCKTDGCWRKVLPPRTVVPPETEGMCGYCRKDWREKHDAGLREKLKEADRERHRALRATNRAPVPHCQAGVSGLDVCKTRLRPGRRRMSVPAGTEELCHLHRIEWLVREGKVVRIKPLKPPAEEREADRSYSSKWNEKQKQLAEVGKAVLEGRELLPTPAPLAPPPKHTRGIYDTDIDFGGEPFEPPTDIMALLAEEHRLVGIVGLDLLRAMAARIELERIGAGR